LGPSENLRLGSINRLKKIWGHGALKGKKGKMGRRSLLDIIGNRREAREKASAYKVPLAAAGVLGAAGAVALAAYLARKYGSAAVTPAQQTSAEKVLQETKELLDFLRDLKYEHTEADKREKLVSASDEARTEALRAFPAFVTLLDPATDLAILVSVVCAVPECIDELDERQKYALVGEKYDIL